MYFWLRYSNISLHLVIFWMSFKINLREWLARFRFSLEIENKVCTVRGLWPYGRTLNVNGRHINAFILITVSPSKPCNDKTHQTKGPNPTGIKVDPHEGCLFGGVNARRWHWSPCYQRSRPSVQSKWTLLEFWPYAGTTNLTPRDVITPRTSDVILLGCLLVASMFPLLFFFSKTIAWIKPQLVPASIPPHHP